MNTLKKMASLIDSIRAPADRHGFNLVAAVSAQRYGASVTGGDSIIRSLSDRARSIIVIGNGGGALWAAFQAHCDSHPGWRQRENPLDDFTRVLIEERIIPPLRSRGAEVVPVYPFISQSPNLNFMELGRISGLGGPSILGVLVHPVYGPWIAFRAALLVDTEVDEPGPALGFDPCPRCATRACIPACPAAAVAYPAGWEIPRCVRYRVEAEPDCSDGCHARLECVLGPQHRYPGPELAYHQKRALTTMRPYYQTHLKRPSG
ncbi:MAG: hypothetical protein ACREP6_15210 [Candidatus Binataceae bacterium]